MIFKSTGESDDEAVACQLKGRPDRTRQPRSRCPTLCRPAPLLMFILLLMRKRLMKVSAFVFEKFLTAETFHFLHHTAAGEQTPDWPSMVDDRHRLSTENAGGPMCEAGYHVDVCFASVTMRRVDDGLTVSEH